MNPPPNREVALFSAALELPADQRAAYLDKACADDPALRLQIEALLRIHDEAIPFLENPASGPQQTPLGAEFGGTTFLPPAEKPGDRIGRYKLLQQIGEGGCGVVYMAEQEEPVRRRVALKIIKLGMDTKQVIARFEAERQALALMDHPNIAKVLDAGATETGRPFFVMELVRGIKITDYSDQNNLSTKERLDLFVQVCRAIQHAHQKGIIHRDIKPSNVLVASNDGVPVPKVIDFGIAKATEGRLTDHTVFTAFEQFIGTPAYMSPEQAALTMLDIDTRTDIYSLGVLLYELLTGTTPFDQKELLAVGLDEMRRTIREKEPVKPSTRLTQELAASTKRSAGFQSAPAIEGQIPDRQGDESSGAHPSTERPRTGSPAIQQTGNLRYRQLIHALRGDLDWIVMKALEKERARRYETANGLATDVQRHLANEPVSARPPSKSYRFRKLVRRNKGTFAAAGALVLMLIFGVVASTWQALRARRAERAQAREKQTAKAEADLLKRMLQGIGPSFAKGRDTKMLQEILDTTAASVEKDLANLPEAEVELSLTLASAYYDMGHSDQMEAVSRHCLQAAQTKLGSENESVADSLVSLGIALLSLAQQHLGDIYPGYVPDTEKNRRLQDPKLQEAEKCCVEGLAIRRKLLGNENVKVARALNVLAQVRLTQYKLAEAESLQRESLEMYKRLTGGTNAVVGRVSKQLALLLAFQEERLAEAEELCREGLAIQKKMLGESHPEIARTYFMLATLLRRQGKWAESETNYVEGVTMWQKMQAGDGFEPANALGYLSEVLMHQDKLAEAEARRREEYEMLKRLYGNEQANVVVSLSWLAYVLQQESKLEEAENRAREAFASGRKLVGGGADTLIFPLDAFVRVLLAQNKVTETEQVFGETLKSIPDGQSVKVYVLRLRSAFYARCRRWNEAITDLSTAIDLDPSDDDPYLPLAVLLMEIGDKEKYRSRCQKMVERFGRMKAASPLSRTAAACLLAPNQTSDSEVVRKLAEEAYALGKDSFMRGNLQFVKALAHYRAEDFTNAIEWVGKSTGQPTMAGAPRSDAAAYCVLAMAHQQLHRPDEARAALTKAADLVNTKMLKIENAPLDENWMDWLIAHILLREAQALIQPPSIAPK